MNKIRITHRYTKNSTLFGVETSYSLEELNWVCSYLQSLKDGLPVFRTLDEDLLEEQVVNILTRLYGCEKIVSDESLIWDGEIDLYDNWLNYVPVAKGFRKLNREYGKAGVRLAIVEQMLIQARKITKDDEGEKIVAQLEYIKSGLKVPPEWGLKICSGDIYEGSINVGGAIDLLKNKKKGAFSSS